jgi:hypothetical protein
MPKLCEYETCRKQASYGDFFGKPLRCKEHKESYKLVSKLCQEEGCKTIACCNYECETNKIYCCIHKKDNMIDLNRALCIYVGCKKQPAFNYMGEIKAIYCSQHKLETMINILTNKCIETNCNTIPVYNYSGEITALYCNKHKKENMVNIKSNFCKEINCNKQPNFNYKHEKNGLYCSIHKKDNMVNVRAKTCIFENCKKVPSYNYIGETKRLYCSQHKLDGMHSLTNNICIENNCSKIATFNYVGENVASYCFEHKLENMIDVKHQKCKSNYCLGSRGNPKYKGYCSSCYQNLFPNDPLTLQMRSKTKEIAVRDYLNLNLHFEEFIHDKPLWTGNCNCTHRRKIDFRKLIGNTLLCIEVDENQHKGYVEKEEEIRYDDLYMLHSGKFIFIRFNPDKFKNKDGKSQNPMLYTRLPLLKEEIEKQIKRIENDENKELLEIIKLYYDEINN